MWMWCAMLAHALLVRPARLRQAPISRAQILALNACKDSGVPGLGLQGPPFMKSGSNLSYDVSCTAQHIGDKPFKLLARKCVHCLKTWLLE